MDELATQPDADEPGDVKKPQIKQVRDKLEKAKDRVDAMKEDEP
jgi:hypothetical protein